MLAPRLECPWALQGGRMTKADLVEKVTAQIARTAGPLISKKDCARVVDSFLDAVKAALAEQHNIEIRGFGTFKIRQRKTRNARHARHFAARSAAGQTMAWGRSAKDTWRVSTGQSDRVTVELEYRAETVDLSLGRRSCEFGQSLGTSLCLAVEGQLQGPAEVR